MPLIWRRWPRKILWVQWLEQHNHGEYVNQRTTCGFLSRDSGVSPSEIVLTLSLKGASRSFFPDLEQQRWAAKMLANSAWKSGGDCSRFLATKQNPICDMSCGVSEKRTPFEPFNLLDLAVYLLVPCKTHPRIRKRQGWHELTSSESCFIFQMFFPCAHLITCWNQHLQGKKVRIWIDVCQHSCAAELRTTKLALRHLSPIIKSLFFF